MICWFDSLPVWRFSLNLRDESVVYYTKGWYNATVTDNNVVYNHQGCTVLVHNLVGPINVLKLWYENCQCSFDSRARWTRPKLQNTGQIPANFCDILFLASARCTCANGGIVLSDVLNLSRAATLKVYVRTLHWLTRSIVVWSWLGFTVLKRICKLFGLYNKSLVVEIYTATSILVSTYFCL